MSRGAFIVVVLAFQLAAGRAEASDWQRSMVWIEATAVRYSHYQPWSSTSRTVSKNGLVIEGGKVLTTAEGLDHATLIRVLREGEGRWRLANIDWIDPHANVALLSAGEDGAFASLPAAPFARRVPQSGPVRIGYFLDGRVISAPGTVRRVHVPRDPQRIAQHMMLEVVTEGGPGAGGSGSANAGAGDAVASLIVVAANEVIGLGVRHDGRLLSVIPTPLVNGLLARKRRDPRASLAGYPFTWQDTQNPATTEYLGLPGTPRGVVVSAVPALSPFSAYLRPRDLILSIDGFEIESDGNYLDPEYGYLPLGNLSTRDKFAGDSSTFEIWRAGAVLTVELALPRVSYADALVPDRDFDRRPEYAVAGGLVFQPLTTDYLRSWDPQWRGSAPFRLHYYLHQPSRAERRNLVVLSQVLPDPFNLGYRDFAFRVVDRINGRPVANLRDLESALENPGGGFHVIDLLPARGPTRLVLDSAGLDEATQRVLRRYGLPAAQVIH